MKRSRIEIMLMLVILFWAGNYTFSKWGMLELSPEMFTLLRFAIVFPLLLILCYQVEKSWRIERADFARVILIGFFGIALYQTLFMASVKYTSSLNASLINALSPIFTGILAVLTKQEHFTWKVQFGSVLAFLGAAMIIRSGSQVNAAYPDGTYGDLMGIAAAFVFGAYPILQTPLLKKYSSLRLTTWSSGIGVLFLLIFNSLSITHQSWNLQALSWIGVLYAAIPVTVYGLVTWNHGVGKIGATKVMVYMYAMPLIACIISFFALGETVRVGQMIGGIIILLGITIVKLPARQNRRTAVEETPCTLSK